MADITNGVTNTSQTITDIIFWITGKLSSILLGIGAVEIILGLLVLGVIYFYFNQHQLQPVRYRRF